MKQSRLDSLMEAVCNTMVGFLIGMVANVIVIGSVLGIHISVGQNFALATAYTLISVARNYAIRRIFNGRSIWSSIKSTIGA